jgi:hypothetical protein
MKTQEPPNIKYWDIAPKLFGADGIQDTIPFLGAGVSVSDRTSAEKEPEPAFPSPDDMDEVAKLAKVDGKARLYLEYAVRTAVRMQAWEEANGQPLSRDALKQRLLDEPYPPFVWELSELLSQLAPYTSLQEKAIAAVARKQLLSPAQIKECEARLIPMLKLLAATTELTNSLDPLTSISSYYESNAARQDLWNWLHGIISVKTTPTRTHELIADAAKKHIDAGQEDYLILTTNYDILMEKALDARQVPYVVLWKNRYNGMLYSRFANVPANQKAKLEERNPPKFSPENFILKKNLPMTILYKMHGCLHPERKPADDGLVITDSDYVDFFSQMGKNIPPQVGGELPRKRLLFLGYSFSDWNVRSIYETVVARANRSPGEEIQDYAVTRYLSQYERTYFDKRNIIVVLEDLSAFVKGVRDQIP